MTRFLVGLILFVLSPLILLGVMVGVVVGSTTGTSALVHGAIVGRVGNLDHETRRRHHP